MRFQFEPSGTRTPVPAQSDIELFDRFAALVARTSDKADAPSEAVIDGIQDCSASLQFIRDVAERVRVAQSRAEQFASEAIELARRAAAALQEAQERAIFAEGAAAAALARAEAAEGELER